MKTINNHLRAFDINRFGENENIKKVIIQSDDWGGIRLPPKPKLTKNLINNFNLNLSPYTKFDTLANSSDLTALMNVLTSVKDHRGKHPIFTFNTVASNPNFKKIRQDNFKNLHVEHFTSTLNRYYPSENVFDVWQQAMNEGLITPQFHGRVHVNAHHWLKALVEGDQKIMVAFNNGFWGIPTENYRSRVGLNLQATYDALHTEELVSHRNSIFRGLEDFKDIFDFYATSFIPNNYVFSEVSLLPILKANGIDTLQGMKYHVEPRFNDSKPRLIRRRNGYYNGFKIQVRNCVFEPSLEKSKSNVVQKCLAQISNSFLLKKPAIISSHRLNYIGSLHQANRDENLCLLEELFRQIVSRWHDVEFHVV